MEKTLAYSYRKLQYWDTWLKQESLGQYLLNLEAKKLASQLSKHLGKHALLVGVPAQSPLLQIINFPFLWLTSAFRGDTKASGLIESDMHALAILTGNIDLAIVPHTLDFIDHPRQLLSEVCRVVKPEGLVAVCGFNPYSLWGMKKYFPHQNKTPWCGSFVSASQIKKWLNLADFQIESTTYHLYFPPWEKMNNVEHPWLETFASLCFPFLGGIYIVIARAKVTPLTPIRLKWKQPIANIKISPTITRPLVR